MAEMPAYVCALIGEINLRRRTGALVKTIYFGGGTPSLLSASQVGEILAAVRANYAVAEGAEITLEANPGTIDKEYLQNLRQGGINRLSLGVQSLDGGELEFLGRQHGTAEALAAVCQARAAGFDNLSLDFIYGLPGRSIRKWRVMLREIIALGAEHLSLYALTVEEGTMLAELARCGAMALPDPDATAREYEVACRVLAQAGYQQYEISNWARQGYSSRHNMTYWTGGEYLGLGCGAHSFGGGVRYAATENLDAYLVALGAGCLSELTEEVLTPRLALSEAMMLGLRLNSGVAVDDIRTRFGIDLHECFKTEIKELVALGLLESDNRHLKLTLQGRLLGNEVFLRFMPP